ncbi:MAG: adenosylcobinamide amidohydrolase [Bryobacterales bacterium]|nr:adenosylcobinamide amidohydrolase [Bryobacterales bacterium]
MPVPYTLETRERWLVARFAEPWMVLSWAVVNGGYQRTSSVVWLYLKLHEIADVPDPVAWMRGQMYQEQLAGAVGFMTSRRALEWVEAEANEADAQAWAVGTVGLSNAMRVGDPLKPPGSWGTINLLVASSVALTPEAALEALALVSEAKTAAMRDLGPHTGTGTDYMAIAWPCAGAPQPYAGKHTAQGAAIGRAAYQAVHRGASLWLKEFA